MHDSSLVTSFPLIQRAEFKALWSLLFLIGLISATSSQVMGHATDESYIWLNPQQDHFDGRVEIRLADLRRFFKLDIPTEHSQARTAVLENRAQLEAYVREKFFMKTLDGKNIDYEIFKVDVLDNEYFGHFAQFFFRTSEMEVPSRIIVGSTMLFEFDRYTRCLLCMEYNEFTGKSHPESFFHAIFSPWNDEQEVDFENIEAVRRGERYYVWEGIRHIWIGLDHILFLVTLLLAAVFVKRQITPSTPAESAPGGVAEGEHQFLEPRYEWVPAEQFSGAFWNIFKIVTIFTIAHSITLSLASLDIISLPSRFVESVIALSIVIVAFNNIVPRFRERQWIVLFSFGLFHGLGFASVMKNLPFRMQNLTSLLVCFNIGVEIGQLVIVAAVFPFIYLLRKTPFYKPVILIGGSSIIMLIAGYWFIERAFGLE